MSCQSSLAISSLDALLLMEQDLEPCVRPYPASPKNLRIFKQMSVSIKKATKLWNPNYLPWDIVSDTLELLFQSYEIPIHTKAKIVAQVSYLIGILEQWDLIKDNASLITMLIFVTTCNYLQIITQHIIVLQKDVYCLSVEKLGSKELA